MEGDVAWAVDAYGLLAAGACLIDGASFVPVLSVIGTLVLDCNVVTNHKLGERVSGLVISADEGGITLGKGHLSISCGVEAVRVQLEESRVGGQMVMEHPPK